MQHLQHGASPSAPMAHDAMGHMSSSSSSGISSEQRPDPDSDGSSLMDIEMTHFFLTKTYETLMFRRPAQVLWRDDIFEFSLSQPALLQGILTTAMLHKIAITDSPEIKLRYTGEALKKQGDALKSFISILNRPSPANCEALFCLSMLLTIWAFASKSLPPELNILHQSMFDKAPNDPGNQITGGQSPVHDFVKIVAISQGVYTILGETLDWLKNSPVNEFMRKCDLDTLPPIEKDADRALTELEHHLEANRKLSGSNSPGLETDEFDLFRKQIQDLRRIFRVSRCAGWHDRIFGWSIMLPNPFVQALKQENYAALIILAYWAACLNALDESWWVHGWPKAIVLDIYSIVQGPWKQFLEWPAQLFTAT